MNHQVVCTADGLLPVGYKIQGYSTIHSHKGTWKDWLSKTIGMKQDFWKSLEFSKINWGRSSELEWCTVYFSLISPMNLTNHFNFFLLTSKLFWGHLVVIVHSANLPHLRSSTFVHSPHNPSAERSPLTTAGQRSSLTPCRHTASDSSHRLTTDYTCHSSEKPS